jgi:hypothetical protein
MTKADSISPQDFARFLHGLGFADKRTATAWVFQHENEGLLVFRLYRQSETMDERDLLAARKFLDMRGVLDAGDLFLRQQNIPT